MIRWLRPLVALFVVIAASTLAKALELRTASSSSLDLAIKGGLAGVPKGEVRYLRWSDLATLPTSKIRITGEFVPGEQEVTVVFLSDLMKALPLQPTVDAALATCTDGFATIFKTSFIGHYRPFLVIEIAGRPPSAWPPPGVTYNPGPYAITVSERLAPDAHAYLDIEHKKPWGVNALEFVSYADCFRNAYSGSFSSLSARAQAGREIWMNSCLCCHAGPAATFSGTKSGRPFAVVKAYALTAPAYFKRYVRNPQGEVTCAQMDAHPHYTDVQLDQLIAYIGLDGSTP